MYADPSAFGEKKVTVRGWARTVRDGKNFGFIELNDGTCQKNCQVVLEREKLSDYEQIVHCGVGAALTVTGTVVLTPEMRQPFVPPAKKAPFTRIFARNCPPAPQD